jgi:hypothetical protein
MTLTGTTSRAAWHRVDVCDSPVLARTRVSLIGVLDNRAIETIDEAVLQAEDTGHTLTFEFGEISSITPDALATLLARAHPPYDGPLGLLTK